MAARLPRSLSRKGWERLLDKDPFGKVRSDEELASLVLQAARHSPVPYAALVTALLGRPGVTDTAARELWLRAVAHRRHMAAALGRPVHLRVAALDLTLVEGARAPVVLDRDLVRDLVDEATSDPLTGLTNRRHLMTVLGHELLQRHRPTVAVMDIDGFKQVNDRHGHARGDEVLRGLADLLRASHRTGDVSARLGGDEFALLLVDSSAEASAAVLARVEAAFDRAYGELGAGLSVGMVHGEGRRTAAELLEEADRLMYASKRRRRRPRREALSEAPPVVVGLYASGNVERFRSFHRSLAGRGLLLLPARSSQVAQRLAPILAPQLILADHLLPPRGGTELLVELGALPAGPRCALVAPERWRGVHRGVPEGIEVLAYPPSEEALGRILDRVAPGDRAPCLQLASEEEASELLRQVARLATGEGITGATSVARGRPELDLLSRLLGA